MYRTYILQAYSLPVALIKDHHLPLPLEFLTEVKSEEKWLKDLNITVRPIGLLLIPRLVGRLSPFENPHRQQRSAGGVSLLAP